MFCYTLKRYQAGQRDKSEIVHVEKKMIQMTWQISCIVRLDFCQRIILPAIGIIIQSEKNLESYPKENTQSYQDGRS